MAYLIKEETYGPRKPKVCIEADSLDELQALTDFAEGSTAVVDGNEYVLDRVNGWTEAGQGGGVLKVTATRDQEQDILVFDKTWQQIYDAGAAVVAVQPAKDGDIPTKHTVVSVLVNTDGATSYDVILSDETYSAETADGYPSIPLK